MYMYIIDQAWGQDGWILAEFSFCVFMDRDKVEGLGLGLGLVNKRFIIWHKEHWKNYLRTCLFSSTEKEARYMQKW